MILANEFYPNSKTPGVYAIESALVDCYFDLLCEHEVMMSQNDRYILEYDADFDMTILRYGITDDSTHWLGGCRVFNRTRERLDAIHNNYLKHAQEFDTVMLPTSELAKLPKFEGIVIFDLLSGHRLVNIPKTYYAAKSLGMFDNCNLAYLYWILRYYFVIDICDIIIFDIIDSIRLDISKYRVITHKTEQRKAIHKFGGLGIYLADIIQRPGLG